MTTDTTALQERLALAISEAEFCRRCEALSMSCEACEARAAAVLPVVKAAQREAVAPVLALHKPRDEQVFAGDCAAEECEHEDECPTVPYTVCAECVRVAEESDPYFGERGLSSVAHPCPTVRAASIEQETQP